MNLTKTGVVHAAECVLEEEHGALNRVGFRYTPTYLAHPAAIPIDPVHLPLHTAELTLQCKGGSPGFLDDYLPDAWGRKILSRLAFYRSNEKFNANSVIDSLALIGTSRIGAISIAPVGKTAAGISLRSSRAHRST
jgi:serine/threonine-protein kinase HipA